MLAAKEYRSLRKHLLLQEAVKILDTERAKLCIGESIKDAAKRAFSNRPPVPLIYDLETGTKYKNDKEALAFLTALQTKAQDIPNLSRWRKYLDPENKNVDLQKALKIARAEDRNFRYNWGNPVAPFMNFYMKSVITRKEFNDTNDKVKYTKILARNRKRRQRDREKKAKLAKPKSG